MMFRFWILLALCLGTLSSCGEFPDLENSITERGRNSPYPRLIQIDAFAGATPDDFEQAEAIAKSLTARVRGLRLRAQALRGPIHDPRTRRKMAAALARHPIANGG